MLLVAGPTPDLLRFIQVVSWIILPVLVSALLITFFLHYRNKRRRLASREEEPENKLMLAMPGQVGYTNGNGEYVLFDHSDLMRQYRNRLSYNEARFTALQYDFAAIEKKYMALADYTETNFITHKKRPMENLQDPLPKNLQAEINRLAADHEEEKIALEGKLAQLEKSFKRLEHENRTLKEQLSLQPLPDD